MRLNSALHVSVVVAILAVMPVAADEPCPGAALYQEHCATCHGAELEGQPNWRVQNDDGTLPAPPHDASGHTWHHSDQQLFDYTKNGGEAIAGKGFKSGMPGFKDTLKDSDIWSVLAYIKSTWPEKIRQRQAKRNEAQ